MRQPWNLQNNLNVMFSAPILSFTVFNVSNGLIEGNIISRKSGWSWLIFSGTYKSYVVQKEGKSPFSIKKKVLFMKNFKPIPTYIQTKLKSWFDSFIVALYDFASNHMTICVFTWVSSKTLFNSVHQYCAFCIAYSFVTELKVA